MPERWKNLLLLGALLAGVLLLGYYSAWLWRDELRSWQELTVEFEDVGGLEAEDQVQVNGARLGRVLSIKLSGERQRVVLQVEPDLVIHRDGHEVTIEPLNPLGFVAVRIRPGDPSSPPIDPGQVLQGRLALGLGQEGAPGPARRVAFNRAVSDMAGLTRDLLLPESGMSGRLLADRTRALALDEGLSELERTWAAVDRTLARVEAGEGPGVLLASRDTALALGETMARVRGFLGQGRDGLQGLERREDTLGRLVADRDVGRGVREFLTRQEALWAAARRHEGALGALHGPELGRTLDELGGRARAWTASGVEGRGLLGALSHPEYDAMAGALHALPGALQQLEASPAVRSPQASDGILDAVGNVDDALLNLRRGVSSLRRGLPDRTSFQGALFAVF